MLGADAHPTAVVQQYEDYAAHALGASLPGGCRRRHRAGTRSAGAGHV